MEKEKEKEPYYYQAGAEEEASMGRVFEKEFGNSTVIVYEDGAVVITRDDTPPGEETYYYVSNLTVEPDLTVRFSTWHGGVASGGFDVWEWNPPHRIEKVRDCPYCREK